MNLLSELKKLESVIAEYAEIAEKDSAEIIEEIKDFITQKKVAAANEKAATSTTEPNPPKAA